MATTVVTHDQHTPFVPEDATGAAFVVRVVVDGNCRAVQRRTAARVFLAAMHRCRPDSAVHLTVWIWPAVDAWLPAPTPRPPRPTDRWVVPPPTHQPRCAWCFTFPNNCGSDVQNVVPFGSAWECGARPHAPLPGPVATTLAHGLWVYADAPDDAIVASFARVRVIRHPCCFECCNAGGLVVTSTVRRGPAPPRPPHHRGWLLGGFRLTYAYDSTSTDAAPRVPVATSVVDSIRCRKSLSREPPPPPG